MATLELESQLLTFFYDDSKLADIECDLIIDDASQWKKIEIKSKDTALVDLQNISTVNIEINQKNFSGEIKKKTNINNATLLSFEVGFGNNGAVKFTIFPENVLITQSNPSVKSKRKVTVKYIINRSPAIAPYCRLIPNENGSIKERKNPPLKIKTSTGLEILSDISFSYSLKGDNFESKRYQHLSVSFIKTKNIVEHINEVITPQIVNFTMISSLIHDERVLFKSWRADFHNTTTWFYNSQSVSTEDINENSFQELIDRRNITDFFNTAMPIYESSPYKPSINNSIYALMLKKNTIVELSFLSYFQALESMILTYKRLKETEFILPIKEFNKLRRHIEKVVSDDYPESPELRSKIKSKISELNRISLREAAEDFIQNFSVKIDNLWPLFDDKKKGVVGLTSIRNILIHGDLLPSSKFTSVIIALEHLRILLIRCIFSLLHWDCDITKVSSHHLLRSHNLLSPELLKNSINDINEHFTKGKTA
ncbi:hypothetical protein UXQ05_02965 [Enterobacter bugandensis]|uniref:HEPN domain-containing protein n=1 Tax=Enterobacter bugandensis TaxID=881260 RepID=UPI002FD19936